MRRDVPHIQRLLRQRHAAAQTLIGESQARLTQRISSVPALHYPKELPITAHLDEIKSALSRHPVVIVAGETGSGKTTQLPKICLESGLGCRGAIAHTQPRRLAARAVASRLAQEMGVRVGDQVGYAVRFTDQTSQATLVKVLTDGLLLTEIRADRTLDAYDAVIVDEAHERSLNIDFLLGYLANLLARRDDLKLIITSATIDVEKFSRHFEHAPVVEVSGRGYPVEVIYRELDDPDATDDERILRCIHDIESRPPGVARDVLVFLPGERDILEASRALRRSLADRWEVLPLYARLPAADQQRIFAVGPRPRIVLATNVAETSLTVPNIGYVVDTGYARVSRYSYRSKLQRLPIERISRASADQRKGRCGRVAPGLCMRLYSETDHQSQSEFTDPEILRTNLAAVVLQMRAFDLGDPATFPFLDPPDPRALRDAATLLAELGALDGDALTEAGRCMARLPVDPRLARMLFEANHRGALTELLVIASGLAANDPRERPLELREAADTAQREFADPRSDFLSLLKIWTWFEDSRQRLTASALKRACRDRFLSGQRLREWRDLHRQLTLTCRELGWSRNAKAADYESIHTSICSGSLSFIGTVCVGKGERGEYEGARGSRFRIFPGSGLLKAQPRWLVAAEIAETQRVYARCAASVEPAWIEAVAAHLVKRSHTEPHWDTRRGEVVAYEHLTLYGLTLVDRRRVSFKRFDRALCRDIFIREALVVGAIQRPPAFLEHNLALVRSVREMEARERRRDLLADEKVLAAFYDERLPADVVDVRSLSDWRRSAEAAEPRRLFMKREHIIAGLQSAAAMTDFPSLLAIGGSELELEYSFAPGAVDDGVSLQVPIGMLVRVGPEPLEWLVPGLFAAKCEELLRTLPKALRRQLAPIADRVEELVSVLLRPDHYRSGRLLSALGERVAALHRVDIPASAWKPEDVPPHLRMNVQVRDSDGRLLDQDRDVAALLARLEVRLTDQLSDDQRDAFEQRGLERFPESGVPRQVMLGEGRARAVAYPALADVGERVDLMLTSTAADQIRVSRAGYVRLVLLADRQSTRQMRRDVRERRQMGLHYAPLGTADQLGDEVVYAGAWFCFFENAGLPEDAQAFRDLLGQRHDSWYPTFQRVLDLAQSILARRFAVARALAQVRSPAFAAAVEDMQGQLSRLVPADFLRKFSAARLADVTRYLDGVLVRLDALQGRVERDREGTAAVHGFEARYQILFERSGRTVALDDLRCDIEEVRIALFAQKVGTRDKMSPKRLETLLSTLERDAGLR